ncbi:MAG: double-strand break repair protein AddB [Alphaproteobacteria bacterium]|nr:double-strand break repair protein AddB [Alphaproteobacteria bacterium]
MDAGPRVFSIPPGRPFLRDLARGILADIPWADDPLALARATVLLPTRRAVRAFGEALVTESGRPALLLPRILPIGDVDEEELALLNGDQWPDIPEAIPALKRQIILARLIIEANARMGLGTVEPSACAALASELARLLDECAIAGADLSALSGLAPERFSEHWQKTIVFLQILTDHWPAILAEEGAIEPAQRRDLLMRRLCAQWAASPPPGPVYAAGSTGSIPATASLLSLIARLPQGAVILPGLDFSLDAPAFAATGPEHPQFGLRHLLAAMQIDRADVRIWPAASGPEHQRARAALLSEVLRPAPTTEAWHAFVQDKKSDIALGLEGLSLINAVSPAHEAASIALAMREAVEDDARTAALITPDRALAQRVAAELARFGIAVDDSAGQPLSVTPAGLFLTQILDAAASNLRPVPLLAALKHPFAACGARAADFRDDVRMIERRLLRGGRPAPGPQGLLAAAEAASLPTPFRRTLERIIAAFAPLLAMMDAGLRDLAVLASAHAAAAEALARDAEGSTDHLWSEEAGEAALDLLNELIALSGTLILRGDEYARLFPVLARARVVRPRRGQHPRVAIWGPLEARLQAADLLILGGLNEGTWPQQTEADAWINRPMRVALGLDQPERRIGLAAHDFAQAAAQPHVILSRAQKSEGQPASPSRWLERLHAIAQGAGTPIALAPHAAYAALIDNPPRVAGASPPDPKPPVATRPRTLSVTEIETWVRDPYALYARRILNLKELEAIDAPSEARERGTLIHAALEEFVTMHPGDWPPDALAQLLRIGERHFAERGQDLPVRALWWPRFVRAAAWFIETQAPMRKDVRHSYTEISGQMTLHGLAGAFTLKAKADRIDQLSDGTLALYDYKTGQIPSGLEVDKGFSPQLTLEGAIAERGGFGAALQASVSKISYLRLSGLDKAGEEKKAGTAEPQAGIARAVAGLTALITQYDSPERGYLSKPRVKFRARTEVYDHLARFAEWSSVMDED